MKAIEIATFRIKPEVKKTAFLAALRDTDRWLERQPGFIARRHGMNDTACVDYVEWQSMADARAGAENFLAAPETQAYMNSIIPDSVTVEHYTLV